MKKWKEWTTKQKTMLGVGIAAVVLIGGGGTVYGVEKNKQEKKADAQETILIETTALTKNGKIGTAIHTLYDTAQPSFLTKDLTQEKLDNAQQALDGATKTVDDVLATYSDLIHSDFEDEKGKLQLLVTNAQGKFDSQTALNDLFEGDVPAINGTEVQAELTIIDSVTTKDIEEGKKLVKTVGENGEDDWLTAMNSILINASSQLDQVSKATEAVSALFDGETVKEDVSEDQYNAAKEEVEAIKNEALKQAQQTRLDQVKAKIAEKKAAEQEAQKAEAEAQAQASGGTVVQNDDGSYTVQAPSTSGGSASSGGNTSSAGSNSSGSTSGGSSWSGSSTSGGSSSGGGSYGGSSGGSSSGSSSNSGSTGGGSSSGGSSSGGSSSGNSNTTSGTTTGGGDSEFGGGATWEGGTFNPGDIMP